MKRIIFSFAIAMFLISCDQEESTLGTHFGKTYELRSLNTGLSGQIMDAKDLDFKEQIAFLNDSTFIKQRVYKDSTSLATGSFSFYSTADFDYLKLTFDTDSYLVQSCGRTLHEYLRIISNDELFNDGYLPCDGPGYHYSRKK